MDFVANFDETTVEPVVLPTKVPNLLVNGSNGIAVGMATNIPPHNLTEIVDASIALVNNPKTTLDESSEVRAGPGLPDRRLHLRHAAASSRPTRPAAAAS